MYVKNSKAPLYPAQDRCVDGGDSTKWLQNLVVKTPRKSEKEICETRNSSAGADGKQD